jgi:hypothetical protein
MSDMPRHPDRVRLLFGPYQPPPLRKGHSCFAILAALACAAAGCSSGGEGQPTEGRLSRLQVQVERQREASAKAAADYAPKVRGRLDDLTPPVADLLRQVPGVVEVEALVSPAKPTRRIVHLRDWHFVPEDLFALDLGRSAGKPLSDAEVKGRYRELLLEVELVQLEQAALLKCLARHHGLRRVLFEGLTPGEVKPYREKVAELRETGPALREQLAEAQRLLKGMAEAGKQQSERYAKALALEEVLALLAEHRLDVLRLGAPGQLLAAGGVEAVLPLDDSGLLDAAKPTGQGKVELGRLEARHHAQVKAVQASGPCSLLVLGGGHDLSASVRRVGGGTTEHLRVTVEACPLAQFQLDLLSYHGHLPCWANFPSRN